MSRRSICGFPVIPEQAIIDVECCQHHPQGNLVFFFLFSIISFSGKIVENKYHTVSSSMLSFVNPTFRLITSDICEKRKNFVCSTSPLYKESDNPCPMNYAPYKNGCYMGVKTRKDYDGAVTTCATVGGIMTPMKDAGIFDFLKAFANAEGKFATFYKGRIVFFAN